LRQISGLEPSKIVQVRNILSNLTPEPLVFLRRTQQQRNSNATATQQQRNSNATATQQQRNSSATAVATPIGLEIFSSADLSAIKDIESRPYYDLMRDAFVNRYIISIHLENFIYAIPHLDDIPVFDQFGYQSCTANAACFMYQQAEYLQGISLKLVPSRMYTWFNAIYTGDSNTPNRDTTKYGNWGTSTTRAVMCSKKDWYGICKEETYKYEGNDYGDSEGKPSHGAGPVSSVQDSEGKKAHAFDVFMVDSSVVAIKEALRAKQRAVSMAFDVYNSGFYADGVGSTLGELHLPVVVDDAAGTNPVVDYFFVYKDDKNVTRRDIAGNHVVAISDTMISKSFLN
jgi:hypothetical protein